MAPALLALLLFATAPAAARPASERYTFGYLVQIVGLFDLRMEGSIDLSPEGYVMNMSLRTEGVAEVAARYRMKARSEGLHASPVTAKAHESEVQSRFIERRTAKVIWNADGTASAEMVPPPKQDGREPVRPEMTRGAVDPLSALLAALLKPEPAAACSGRTAVFDGRRRYDTLPKALGQDNIEPRAAGAYRGPALHCELYIERIGGYSAKDFAKRRPEEPGFEVWFARRPDLNILLPVKVFADTRYGETVASLTRLERNGQPIDLQAR